MPRPISPRARAVVTSALATSFVALTSVLTAQTPPPRHDHAPAAAPAASDAGATSGIVTHVDQAETPGTFRGPQAIASRDVTTGSAGTTATGPTSEMRANTEPTPDLDSGPIGPADVARLISVRMPLLRPCYEQARAAHPRLAGRVELRFTIIANGHVSRADVSGMPEAPEVGTCLEGVLRQSTFPQPADGTLEFIYPVSFTPPVVLPHGRQPPVHARPGTAPAAHP